MRNIFVLIILTSILIFTSFIKNKTRLIEKQLVNLNNETNSLRFKLSEASLDFEYLSTPKQISILSKNFLDENFSYYKESQINQSTKKVKVLADNQLSKEVPVDKNSNDAKKISDNQLLITKRAEDSQLFVEKRIDYKRSQSSIKKNTPKKVQRWVGIQIVKTLLGIPSIPGTE